MEIKGHTLEFYEDDHIYLCDGMILSSITQILAKKFGKKYDSVPLPFSRQGRKRGQESIRPLKGYARQER